jgi:ParB-like nuclease domain
MQEITEVKEHELTPLKIADLVIDPDNPNYMTEEQMEALRESMRKFGYLAPVTVDQDNMIADGQHRVQIYKEFGKQYINGYKLNLTDNDRRMLRQVQNKLKGQHEPGKEHAEFVKLLNESKESDKTLLGLLNVNRGAVMELESLIELNKQREKIMLERLEQKKRDDGPYYEEATRLQDGNTIYHGAETFLYGNIKQITAYFDNTNYEKAIEMMKELMDIYKIKNHTDLIWSMLNHIYLQREFKNMEVLTLEPPEKSKMEYDFS